MRRSMVIVCLTAALVVTLLVVLSLSRDDLIRRYHFVRWKTIVLNGLVDVDGAQSRLSLSDEDESVAWRHLMTLKDAEGYDFLMKRVLEGGERDATGGAIALGSIYSNTWDTRQPIPRLVITHEPALRVRAEGAGSSLLRSEIQHLYTYCRNEVRNVKRSKPRPALQAPGD